MSGKHFCFFLALLHISSEILLTGLNGLNKLDCLRGFIKGKESGDGDGMGGAKIGDFKGGGIGRGDSKEGRGGKGDCDTDRSGINGTGLFTD